MFLIRQQHDIGEKSKGKTKDGVNDPVTEGDMASHRYISGIQPVSEFNEFNPRLNFPKNRFQLSAGLNLEKLNTILSGPNHI